MNIITIDCGASFIKAGLFKDGIKIKSKRMAAPGVSPSPLDSAHRIKKLMELVKDMLLSLSERGDEILLCISNEMHGFVLADAAGEPWTDYVSWQTELGDGGLKETSEISETVARSGMQLRGGLPSCNLSWMSENGLLKEGLFFYTLGDYLIRFLSGSEPFAHPSNAAATGLFDLKRNAWNTELIRHIGIEGIAFPEVAQKCVRFKADGRMITALPAIGDQQAALLGAGLRDKDTLSFNLGTGAQVSRLSDTAEFGGSWQVRPYFSGKYLLSVPHIPSGRAINVLFRLVKSVLEQYSAGITDEKIWEGILEASTCGNKTSLKADIGFFENAVNDSTTGSLTGIGEYDFSMPNLFYAVVMQMAENYCICADRIWADHGSVKTVMFSGGIAEKYGQIRERIMQNYPDAEQSFAKGDTLEGLSEYAGMNMEIL